MLKKIVGKVWRKLPYFVKRILIRASQTTFTVSVGAVVLNKKKEILLLDHVLRPASGWGIPGGFINPGEHPEQAVKREIYEETGLEIVNVRMRLIRTLNQHLEMIFIAEGNGEAVVKSAEINSLAWFEFDRMPPEMSRSQFEIIEKVLSKSEN